MITVYFRSIVILHWFEFSKMMNTLLSEMSCTFHWIWSLILFASFVSKVAFRNAVNNWRQRSIKAYDISNQSTSYRAQLYDQNKLLFDSIASQMTVSQVKNRKLKFFALTQVKIGDETRVHQRRRKNHQFRQ